VARRDAGGESGFVGGAEGLAQGELGTRAGGGNHGEAERGDEWKKRWRA
jgi:hypothetical protein